VIVLVILGALVLADALYDLWKTRK